MKLVVALGSIDKLFQNSRFNVGFKVIEILAAKWKSPWLLGAYAVYAEHETENGEKVILMKSTSDLDLVGKPLSEYVKFYGLKAEDVAIVQDDPTMPLGVPGVELSAPARGHKTIENIFKEVGDDKMARFEIGMGDEPYTIMDGPYRKLYGLGWMQMIDIGAAQKTLAEAVEKWLDGDAAGALALSRRPAGASAEVETETNGGRAEQNEMSQEEIASEFHQICEDAYQKHITVNKDEVGLQQAGEEGVTIKKGIGKGLTLSFRDGWSKL